MALSPREIPARDLLWKALRANMETPPGGSKMPDTLETRSWETMPCTPDDGPARTAAIGLITLSNDVVIERELRTFLTPVEGAAVFASRIPLMLELTPQALR